MFPCLIILSILQIAKYLEERCHKELRLEHFTYINTIVAIYNKLVSNCREQMYEPLRSLDIICHLVTFFSSSVAKEMNEKNPQTLFDVSINVYVLGADQMCFHTRF